MSITDNSQFISNMKICSSSIKSRNTVLKTSRRQSGFSMLEALVGFLILATGLLGIASLQTLSIKAGQTSVYSSIALLKADELIEIIRANPGSTTTPNVLDSYVGAGSSKDCTSNNCSESDMALNEKFLWSRDLAASLPGTVSSTVTVTAAVAPSSMATIDVAISWQERSKTADGSVNKSLNITSTVCTAMPC